MSRFRHLDVELEVLIEAFLLESNKIEYIHEPITRQDIEVVFDFLSKPNVSIEDLESIAYYLQPDARLRDGVKSFTDVQLPGTLQPPAAGPEITARLERLLFSINHLKGKPDQEILYRQAYILHQEYERLHPFSDCNGRTGRLLLFWMLDGNFDQKEFLHWWYLMSFQM